MTDLIFKINLEFLVSSLTQFLIFFVQVFDSKINSFIFNYKIAPEIIFPSKRPTQHHGKTKQISRGRIHR